MNVKTHQGAGASRLKSAKKNILSPLSAFCAGRQFQYQSVPLAFADTPVPLEKRYMIPKSSLPKSNVLTLAEQAHSLCEPLERGQANKPLTDALRVFCEAGEAPLVVSILCLDAAARQFASAGGIITGSAERSVACRVADCGELLTDIVAYQNFCRGAHALLVVGSPDCQLDQRHLQVVGSVGELFPLVWPIVIGSDDRSIAWLSSVRSASGGASLPPNTHHNEGPAAVDWPERLQTFREPLFLQQRSNALTALLEKLAARAEHELAYLTQAQSRLEIPAKSTSMRGAADSEKELAPLRERLAEQAAAIDRQLTLKSDRSTQPLGELSGMMRSVSTSINIEDLDKTRTSALLKLSVNASHLARINRRIEHALRQEFVNDLQQIQRQMREATDELLGTLCARLGAGLQVKLPVLDVNHAWRSVENLMAIGKETHIELARKGFFDVLTAGRQKVFIIIMFASLMGRMGLPNLFTTPAAKAAFGLFMAVVMVGSMISAVLHWRREKQVTSEKELSKIRDSLLAEGSKVIDQVERVKLTAMREYLKDAARTFECTVKQSVEETLAEQRVKREAELQKQEAMRKSLEVRLKQATEVQRGVGKLLDQARGLSTIALRSLREVAARPLSSPEPTARATLTEPIEKPAEKVGAVAEPVSESQMSAVEPLAADRPTRSPRTPIAGSERPRSGSALADRRQRRELTLGKTSEN